jgi:hypothetical protein
MRRTTKKEVTIKEKKTTKEKRTNNKERINKKTKTIKRGINILTKNSNLHEQNSSYKIIQ